MKTRSHSNGKEPSPNRRTYRYALLGLALGSMVHMQGQVITNGDFQSGTAAWTGCIVEIASDATYGGSGTSLVAEVDGNTSTSSSDDRILCQTVPGFTIGDVYRIDFNATRRGTGTPPPTVTVTMTMDDAMNETITRTGGYSMVHGSFYFTATFTAHQFVVKPDFEGLFGMLFDNIRVSLVSALPIELLYFDAEAHGTQVELSWATASETNNDLFTVQRSRDGIIFEDLQSIDGADQSQCELTYALMDAEPIPGLSYYRLSQTDLDGATTVFDMVPVRTDAPAGTGISLFPNPASDGPIWMMRHVPGSKEPSLLTIEDPSGRKILSRTIPSSDGPMPIDLRQLMHMPPGSYMVSVHDMDRSSSARLLIGND